MRNTLTPAQKGSQGGFTLLEMLIASSLSVMTIGLVYTALVGMQVAAKATVDQVQLQRTNKFTLQKVGRIIQSSSKVQVDAAEGPLGTVHVWSDNQEVWTPDTTDDDDEGKIYYDLETQEVLYNQDIEAPNAEPEVLAENIEKVTFEMVGNAVFMELTMDYDVDDKIEGDGVETQRTLYASFASRNTPRTRIGATQ